MKTFNQPFNRRPNKYVMIQASAGGGAATYNVDAFVGGFTSPSATGNFTVSGIAFQPKLLSFMDILAGTSTSLSSTDLYFSNGYATANEDVGISVFSDHGVLTTNTTKRHDNVYSLVNTDFTNTVEQGYITTLNAAGFSGYMNKVNSGRNHSYFALGGDIQVKITEHQMNATNASQSFAHGLGVKPDVVMFIGVNSTVAPPESSNNLRMVMGAANGTTQCGASVYSTNAQSTSICRRAYSNDKVILYIDSAGIQRSMAVSSIDATNVNVTYPNTSDANQWRFFMIAINGCRSQIGSFDTNGLTTPNVITCTGIIPKLLLTFSVAQGADLPNSGVANSIFALGMSDGTNTKSMGIWDSNNVTTTIAYRYQSSSGLVEYSASTKMFEAGVSFSGENVVITPVLNNSVYGQGGYIIIGE